MGLGRIGSLHAANIAALPGLSLTYLYEEQSRLRAKMQKQFAVPAARDLDEILQDPNTNLLIICTPTPTHRALIKRAVAAGKAVFCEKPLCGSLKEARDCLAYVRKHKGIMMVGFNRRFDRDNLLLKKQLGGLGALEHIHITSRDPAPPPIAYIKQSGGIFMDMTIHDLDMALHLMPDPPVRLAVMASVLTDPAIGKAGDMDSALISMTTRSGCLVSIHNSRRACYGYDQRIEVFGAKGMAQTANQKNNDLTLATTKGFHQPPLKHFFLERYMDSYREELMFLARGLNGNKTALEAACAINGVNATYLAEMASVAFKNGRGVNLKLPQLF